ncbi:MAG: hypothetical protein J6Q89_02550 [Clostridia bacterium]|nr:hypothetical protein [Clostridia bacterium]
MISTIELYKAIRERLEKTFPNVLVQQKDIKNIQRPSFYIQYVGKNLDKQALEYWEDRISFNIVYFSQREELLELLEVEENFIRAFKDALLIKDDTKVIEVKKDALNVNLNEEDYFINLTIDFVLMQRMSDDEDGDEMEEIGVSIQNSEDSVLYENEEIMSDVEIN